MEIREQDNPLALKHDIMEQ